MAAASAPPARIAQIPVHAEPRARSTAGGIATAETGPAGGASSGAVPCGGMVMIAGGTVTRDPPGPPAEGSEGGTLGCSFGRTDASFTSSLSSRRV
jgi:hypothetical protein